MGGRSEAGCWAGGGCKWWGHCWVSCQVGRQIVGCRIVGLLSESRGQVGGVRFESRGHPGELPGRWVSRVP